MLRKISQTFKIALIIIPTLLFAESFKLDKNSSKAIPTYLGKVKFMRGEAVKIRAGKKQETILKLNEKIMIGDTIKTRKKTIVRVLMEMVDNSTFTIGPKSTFIFVSDSFNKEGSRSTLYRFLKGKLRASFPNKSKAGAIKFELGRNISMGVRGTVFLSNIHKSQNANGKTITQIGLLSGKINVKNISTSQKYKMNPKDHFISVENSDEQTFNEKIGRLTNAEYNKLLNEKVMTFLKRHEEKNRTKKIQTKSRRNKTSHPENGKNWRESLKKLNKRLDQNSKN